MRNLISMVAVLGFVALFSGCSDTASPTAETVKAPLMEFWRAEYSGKSGVEIDGPKNIRVGQYAPELGGWPVFADYAISYKDNGTNFTIRSSEKTPAAYAKNVAGATVCFTPDLFKKLEKEMEAKFDKAFAF